MRSVQSCVRPLGVVAGDAIAAIRGRQTQLLRSGDAASTASGFPPASAPGFRKGAASRVICDSPSANGVLVSSKRTDSPPDEYVLGSYACVMPVRTPSHSSHAASWRTRGTSPLCSAAHAASRLSPPSALSDQRTGHTAGHCADRGQEVTRVLAEKRSSWPLHSPPERGCQWCVWRGGAACPLHSNPVRNAQADTEGGLLLKGLG